MKHLRKLTDFPVFLPAYQGLYVPAGTPPTQPVAMPVIQQQPDVILRQDMAVAPGKSNNIVLCTDFLFFINFSTFFDNVLVQR